jgi:mono/diheme cytochrome c family protein
MKRLGSFQWLLRAGTGLALVTAAFALLASGFVRAADTPAPPETKTKPDATPTQKPAAKPAQQPKLTGQELYAIHCNRCHQERYPTEFTASQWGTLLLHMRVRANLPADQTKAILKYLQEESGN